MDQEQMDKLKGYASGGGGKPSPFGKGNYFTPKVKGKGRTDYLIRILDGVNGQAFVSPGSTHYFTNPKNGGTCPNHFLEDVQQSKADGDSTCLACETFFAGITTDGFVKKAKANGSWDTFRSLSPKTRLYFNIYDFETGQVLIWGIPGDTDQSFGSVLVGEIVSHYQDVTVLKEATDTSEARTQPKKIKQVLHPTKGFNFKLDLTPRGAAFVYHGDFVPRSTKLPKDIFKDWQDHCHDLEAVPKQKVLSGEEIQTAVEHVLEKMEG